MKNSKKDYQQMGLDPKYCGDFDDFHESQTQNDPEYKKEYERLELQKRVAGIIVHKRQEKRLSQQDLAKRAHTTQSVISRIENGNVSVGLQMLQKIAEALDSKVDVSLY